MITPVARMKIIGYMKQCPRDRLSFPGLCKYVNSREKIIMPEYLEFFVEMAFTELKREKLSLSLLNKVIVTITSFVEWNKRDGFEVKTETLDNVSSIRSLYEAYKEKIGDILDIEKDEEIEDNIGLMEDKVKEMFPEYEYVVKEVIEEVKDEEIIKLEDEIERQREELEALKDKIKALESDVASREGALRKREKKNIKLSTELERKKAKINEINKALDEASKRIKDLKRICEDNNKTIMILSEENSKLLNQEKELKLAIFTLNKELKRFRKLLLEKERVILECKQVEEEIQKKEQERLQIEIRDREVEELLINRMILGYSNNEELIAYLREIGYNLSDTDCISYINKIKYSGVLDTLRDRQSEFVLQVGEQDDSIYNIGIDTNIQSYDLLVVSDFHLESFSKSVIEEMDELYEYSIVNNIPLILNAGDFFSFKHHNRDDKEKLIEGLKKLIDKVIDKFPQDLGIKQAILGGNHDRDAVSYGVDPIERLVKDRSDFINLGYGHAAITFGDNEANSIGIHHPNRRYQDFVGNKGYNSGEVLESLESYYRSNSMLERDSIYVDILGHIHKSSLDLINGICIAPSYRRDRFCNGAWHLKIFFDNMGNIKEIVFIPLIKNKGLVSTTEICYQKRLIK